jgi:hypothetical protein
MAPNEAILFIYSNLFHRSIPMRLAGYIAAVIALLALLGPFASANVATTTMTWVVPTVKQLSLAYGSPCTSTAFFFVESNAQYDPDSDGNWARAVPQSTRAGAGDSNCQSSSQAGMVVSNNGTATINVDANFTTDMTGADINLELKVWMGTGSGCGTAGLGGWTEPCTVTSTTSAPTATTCKEFSSGNGVADTAGTRLVTSLIVFDSNQLCYSGDLNGMTGVGAGSGDHNKSFQIGSEFS